MSISRGEQTGKSSLISMAEDLHDMVLRGAAEGLALRDVERAVLDRLLKMGHAAMEQFLSLQGNGDLGQTLTTEEGEILHRSDALLARPLRTIFGAHEFSAFVYRRRKHPNTPIVLRPIDARMQLGPGRWSRLLEEFTQLFCIDQAYAPAAKAFERIFGQRLSVDTLERVNLRMGQEAAAFLDRLKAPSAKEEGELLVVTGDGKGVPLVKADAEQLRSFEERPQRPGNRRMATLAGVYSVDRYVRTPEQFVAALFRDIRTEPDPEQDVPRPKPCHKRIVARFPQEFEDGGELLRIPGAIVAMSWAAREVDQRCRAGQTVIRLMDGQESLWNAADICLAEVPENQRVDILDIVHVASYVWQAAKVFHAHQEHQEAFARERLLRILHGDVKGVVSGLRQTATRRGLRGDARTTIDTVCRYFTVNAHRMRYEEYLAAGYPIATGVIEGACRHLVKDRMERSGMRWTQTQAQSMLDLRALHESSNWDSFHAQRVAHDSHHDRLQALIG